MSKKLSAPPTLKEAFVMTCKKRGTENLNIENILAAIATSKSLKNLWETYQKKYSYAADTTFDDVVSSANQLAHMVTS